MKILTNIHIRDDKIKELAREEIKDFEFKEIEEIKNRLDKIEETLALYKRYLGKDNNLKEWWKKK